MVGFDIWFDIIVLVQFPLQIRFSSTSTSWYLEHVHVNLH